MLRTCIVSGDPSQRSHRQRATVDIDQGSSPVADHAARDCAGNRACRLHSNSLHRPGSVKWPIF
ncbi:hypothetical protein DXU07_01790 [Bradyrhizobium elkanii]|nr:hypothetical protein [Bradyrhizobium elkanii]NWL66934.1 hypothetical protein [Bradyrhizobium elkanii]OIM90197.1 hypothetical protein BLN97_34695 [Bradyrhizobium elkanii]QOZ16765.1 hypothetical protein XI02_18500 [Bradyrhizobium sp. CCBAU 21365]RYM22100.1 hypothetical protein EWH13_23160 [Bradyrhizobium elkanii]